MRPIDADAIKLPEGFFEKVDNVPKFYDWLNSLPTIDAVPVVRCKDCIFVDGINMSADRPILYGCSRFNQEYDVDFYCAYGKRRADA